jgi:epoxyqueuosine reductase QueG
MTDPAKITRNLRDFACRLGISLFGAADLSSYYDEYRICRNLLHTYPMAISIGIRLSDPIVEMIDSEDPGALYAHHYRVVNNALDLASIRIADHVQELGYKALPVPASQIIDEERLLGAISHKAVAALAGHGWQGKSLLIINEEYGPRVRYASILTDAPLEPGTPIENRCGNCTKCADACPVRAIKGARFKLRPSKAFDAVDLKACDQRLWEMSKRPFIGSRVCGVCVKVCPWGRKIRGDHQRAL